MNTRRAIARGRLESIQRYLPGNYDATLVAVVNNVEIVLIEGSDQAGWTLDGYVIPRLASGLYPAREIPVLPDPPPLVCEQWETVTIGFRFAFPPTLEGTRPFVVKYRDYLMREFGDAYGINGADPDFAPDGEYDATEFAAWALDRWLELEDEPEREMFDRIFVSSDAVVDGPFSGGLDL